MRKVLLLSALLLVATAAFQPAYADDAFYRLDLKSKIIGFGSTPTDPETPPGPGTNNPVQIQTDAPADIRASGSFTLNVMATGALASDVISLEGPSGPVWLQDPQVYGRGSISWNNVPVGTHEITVRVSGADTVSKANTTVSFTAHPQLQVAVGQSSYSVEVGGSLSITPTVSNAIDNVLWGATPALPSWLAFDDATGRINVDTSSARTLSGIVLTGVDQADMDDASTAPFSVSVTALTATNTETETETGSCDAGYSGQTSRTRTITTWSNGTSTTSAWSAWSTAGCYLTVASTATDSEYDACEPGFTGQQVRTRTITTWSNGSTTAGSWSAWSSDACEPAVAVSTFTDTFSQACGTGMTGNETKSRTGTNWSDGRTTYGAYGSWDRTGCSELVVDSYYLKREELFVCNSSKNAMTVRTYRTLKEKMYSGTIRSGAEEISSTQSCPSTGTYTRTVYSYDPTGCIFGKVKRASQGHNLVYSSSTGKYTRTTGSWVNFGSCGTY